MWKSTTRTALSVCGGGGGGLYASSVAAIRGSQGHLRRNEEADAATASAFKGADDDKIYFGTIIRQLVFF
jgi:hypothetical protein